MISFLTYWPEAGINLIMLTLILQFCFCLYIFKAKNKNKLINYYADKMTKTVLNTIHWAVFFLKLLLLSFCCMSS